MTAMSPLPDLQLRIERVIEAPRDKVFAAWTKPDQILKWWLPEGMSDPKVEIELREGGRFRFGMRPPEGDPFFATGTFTKVDPPKRLAHTWNWEGAGPDMEMDDTEVTIDFEAIGSTTKMVLTHRRFADGELRDKHEQGWNACLDRMAKTVEV